MIACDNKNPQTMALGHFSTMQNLFRLRVSRAHTHTHKIQWFHFASSCFFFCSFLFVSREKFHFRLIYLLLFCVFGIGRALNSFILGDHKQIKTNKNCKSTPFVCLEIFRFQRDSFPFSFSHLTQKQKRQQQQRRKTNIANRLV